MFYKTLGLNKSPQLHLMQALSPRMSPYMSPRMSPSSGPYLTRMVIQFRGWLWLLLIFIKNLFPFLGMQQYLALTMAIYLCMPMSDLWEIIQGNQMLNIAVIQLWIMWVHSKFRFCIYVGVFCEINFSLLKLCECRYLNELIVNAGHNDIYGFLEPQIIQKSGNRSMHTQRYIQRWIHESKKRIYIAPYIEG